MNRRPQLALLALAAVVAAIHAWLLDWLGGSGLRPPPAALVIETPPRPVIGAVLVAVMTAAQASPSVEPTTEPPRVAVAATPRAVATVLPPQSPRVVSPRAAPNAPDALPDGVPAASLGAPALHAADPAAEPPQEPPVPAANLDVVGATDLHEAAAPIPPTAQQLAVVDLAAATPSPSAPAYRTRIPPSAKIIYQLTRGLFSGTGTLDWRVAADRYELRLDGAMPLIGTLLTQTSRGRFDAAGLAPERYTEKRPGRSEQAANFQRLEGQVSFSGGAPAQPLVPGLQDRLSVMLQLAAIAAAGPQPPPAGQVLSIPVVSARGVAAAWTLRFEGLQTVQTPAGAIRAWRYERQPDLVYDTHAELWLDPARLYLPVRVRFTDNKGEPLELLLQSRTP